MPPRDPKPAISRRKPKLKLDVQEPALTNMLEKYCDLRRRGFGQKAIQTKANWPRHYPSLLLEEAQRREMTGSQGSQKQAVTEWLLAIAAGTGDVLMARLRKGRANTARGAASLCIFPSAGPGKTSSVAPWLDCEPFHSQPDGGRLPLTRHPAI